MALVSLRLGLKKVGNNNNHVFSKAIKSRPFDIRTASITGAVNRSVLETEPKPKPWPYERYGYTNFHAWIDDTLKRFDDNTKIITVEGPPAIGKSKFAKALAEDLDMLYLPMPTTDLYHINDYGYDFRDVDPKLPYYAQSMDEMKFIKDPHQENAPQLSFLLYYMKVSQYIDALMHLFNTGQGIVIERCCYTDNAFVDALTEVKYLRREEKSGYYKLKSITLDDLLRPHLAIYLDASVDTVLKNFKKRGLGEEKTYNGDFLSALEENYKRKSLVELEKHAEVLSYDWNEPGDSEVVVEDIERIDFERFGKHDEKMKDWRIPKPMDFSESRWFYTQRKHFILADFSLDLFDCPRLYMDGDSNMKWKRHFHSFPGNEYLPGFNPRLGDKVQFLFGFPPQRLPDCVTDEMRKRLSFSGRITCPKPPLGKSHSLWFPPEDIEPQLPSSH